MVGGVKGKIIYSGNRSAVSGKPRQLFYFTADLKHSRKYHHGNRVLLRSKLDNKSGVQPQYEVSDISWPVKLGH